MADLVSTLLYGGMRFVASAALAVGSIYFGVKAFDRLTEEIEEFEELKKGNVAVGIMIAAVIIAIAAVMRGGIADFAAGIQPGYPMQLLLLLAAVNLVKLAFALVVAVVMIYASLNMLDWLTKNINEMEELKRENVAIAILIAGVLVGVALGVEAGMRASVEAPEVQSCAIADQLGQMLGIDASACMAANATQVAQNGTAVS